MGKILSITIRIVLDFVKAISRTINRPHVLVAYFSAEIKAPDDLRHYNTHVHTSACVIRKNLNVY